MIFIWIVAIFLFIEATFRIINKDFVEDPRLMFVIAVVGLIIRIILANIVCLYPK